MLTLSVASQVAVCWALREWEGLADHPSFLRVLERVRKMALGVGTPPGGTCTERLLSGLELEESSVVRSESCWQHLHLPPGKSWGRLKMRSQLVLTGGNLKCLEQWRLSFQSYHCSQKKCVNIASIWFPKTQTSVGMF